MSLVKSAAMLGTLKNGNDGSGLSTSKFNYEKHGVVYTSESYSSNSCDPSYLLDSPSDELVRAGSINKSPSPSSKTNPFVFDSEFEYMDGESLEVVDYDEDKMRLKLEELEKALLDDNSAKDVEIDNHYLMEIDGDWADTADCALLRDSPKESSSSDSNRTCISSSAEIPSMTAASGTPKSLLFECAESIHYGHLDKASQMIKVLRERVSIQGDPSERIAAYMVEALVARMATPGRGLYKVLKCKEQPSSDRLSAMQVLFEVCPCFRFGFVTANGAILEACEDEKRVHIVDFDVNQGSQYYTLLQTLAKLPGPRPHVKLTGVDDPESVQRAVGGLKIIGQRLEQLAEYLHLSFEFHAVAAETALVSPSTLRCQPGEALVVNFAFQLHHMPDESVSTVNLRDQLLRMVKSLKPKLVIIVEQDMNTNTAPFLSRFAEAYNYYSAVFESLDATLPRDSQDRINVEKQCLARDIINIIACEGEERIERYEAAGKWRARMSMAGFTSSPISPKVINEIRELIQQYSNRFKVKDEMGALHFGWEDKILIVSSAWK